jgi:glucosamine--fructose-6-phosphate aminotransferase (isomerizing)
MPEPRPRHISRPRPKTIMLKEIHAAPERVEMLLARELAGLRTALARFREERPPLILVAGRGTSDNAAVYGRYLFEHFAGIPVSGAALSLFTLYPAPMHLKGALAIGVSQSGESPDVVKALHSARRAGAFALAITNTPQSSLVEAADYAVLLHAGKERAVAATKTYTTELVAMLMTCLAIGGKIEERQLASIPDALRTALQCDEAVAGLAPYFRYASDCVCLARGFNFATAREIALKLQETCYIPAEGMSAADFLHGPIAMLDERIPLLLFAPHGPTYRFMLNLARRLRRQGADVIAFTDRDEMARAASIGIYCPFQVEEGLSPLPLATLGQLFACHLALERGLNPDAPRRLRKVTRTL